MPRAKPFRMRMALMPARAAVCAEPRSPGQHALPPAYGLAQLHGDQERFASLLSGCDGDQLTSSSAGLP